MIITLDGLPGSGKSTQCEILKDLLSVPYFCGSRDFFAGFHWLFEMREQSREARGLTALVEIADAVIIRAQDYDSFLVYDFLEPFFYGDKASYPFLYSFFRKMLSRRSDLSFVNFFFDVPEKVLCERTIKRDVSYRGIYEVESISLKQIEDDEFGELLSDGIDFMFENNKDFYLIDGSSSETEVTMEIKDVLLDRGITF